MPASIGNLKSEIQFGKRHSIALRILNKFKIRNTQPSFLNLQYVFKLESLDNEIYNEDLNLQVKYLKRYNILCQRAWP